MPDVFFVARFVCQRVSHREKLFDICKLPIWEFDAAGIIWMEATSEQMQKLYRKFRMTNRYYWYSLYLRINHLLWFTSSQALRKLGYIFHAPFEI